MGTPRRVEKVNILLREVVAGILSRDMHFPPGALVTVTRAETSGDLYRARVFVSVMSADAAHEQAVLDQLTRACGAVQHALNRRLRMRPVPRIAFEIDRGEKRRERIEKLLSTEGIAD